MEWVRNPITGSFKTTVSEREFVIEPIFPPHAGWEVWYGRAGRRLRIGLTETLSAAKDLAEDTLAGIQRIHKIVGE